MSPFSLGILASAYVAPSGGPWSPADLSPFAWYDASDAATITSSGGAVSAWGDKSPNARHLSSGAAQPTTGTRTQNGLNVIEFTQDWMQSPTFTVAQPITVALVGAHTAVRTYAYYLSLNPSTAFGAIGRATTNWCILGPTALTSSVPVVAGAPPSVHVGIFNGDSSAYRIDGAQVTGNVGTGSGTRITLGNYTAATGGMSGYLGEVIIASGALTGDILSNLETYLTTKWGVT